VKFMDAEAYKTAGDAPDRARSRRPRTAKHGRVDAQVSCPRPSTAIGPAIRDEQPPSAGKSRGSYA
jgi:hypothetical protein